MIGLVTDSNSQIPSELADRYGVEVVPLTVMVDGEEYLEGVDIDAGAFYARFEHRRPMVTTAQPSPGRFAEAYEEAAGAAERVGATVGNVFVVGALDMARAGGRLAGEVSASSTTIPVLTLAGGVMREVDRCDGLEDTAEAMAGFVRAGGPSLRVGVGVSDPGTLPLVEGLEERLRAAPEVRELVRYVIGPSVGAHTGPGTVGAMFAPVPDIRCADVVQT